MDRVLVGPRAGIKFEPCDQPEGSEWCTCDLPDKDFLLSIRSLHWVMYTTRATVLSYRRDNSYGHAFLPPISPAYTVIPGQSFGTTRHPGRYMRSIMAFHPTFLTEPSQLTDFQEWNGSVTLVVQCQLPEQDTEKRTTCRGVQKGLPR
ncbi:hypothetical protein MLD38_006920 [Melastoma candidum]|uniref:Uncharacterized protein n=1 Tax=Melastoma candidum TaxID=119954 RepID=A0ACB9RPK0_9MYRT|nr:hypothetical protein MLD38_006920 [Melastoma candidum]